jgi:hypothetical protein
MAEPIKPSVMNVLLGNQNWTMATEVGELAIDPGLLFPTPEPPPRPALVVPVDVQALFVPPNHTERYVKLPMELTGLEPDRKVQPPFSAPRSRAQGVHLHWALPDGLLRGEMQDDEDTPITMRPLPNRWLVVRMTGRRGRQRLDTRSWVIEAENGRVFDLAGYPRGNASGDGEQIAADELDGIVGGSPNWTASYDAALNRFAFHDTLSGLNPSLLTNGLATYVVIGWWSERAHDPLSGAYSSYSASKRIANLGWSASPAPSSPGSIADPRPGLSFTTQGDATPGGMEREIDLKTELKLSASQAGLSAGFAEYRFDDVSIARLRPVYDTLMHGVVYGVPVGGRVGRDLAPPASRISVSMGPTLERLIAAQAAKGMGVSSADRREYLESLVTAIANSSIMEVNSRDGVVKLDEAEHADGFETFRGPESYEDVIVERKQADLSAGRPVRTKAAVSKSGSPPKADVIWSGRRNTRHKPSMDEMRETAGDMIRKGFGPPLAEGEEVRRIRRPGPRYHRATPPVIGLRNFGKANRFHGDGRFSEDDKLLCRWTGELAYGFGEFYRGNDFVPRLNNKAIPRNADRILWNSYLYDPYMLDWAFGAISQTAPATLVGPTQNRLRGEMALRYSGDGVYDGIAPIARSKETLTPGIANQSLSDELRRFSLIEGRDPSPVAVTSWAQPWSPVWLEWEVELEPGSDFEGWTLGHIDFAGDGVSDGTALTLRGRSPITSGLSKTYQAVIDGYLVAENQRDEAGEGEISETHERNLADLSEFLDRADLGSVTLDRIDELWLALDNGPDGQVRPAPESVATSLRNAGLPRLIASGTLRLTRARLIDTFGRFRDLRTDRVTLPTALSARSSSGANALAMPPRLALPSRLMWRFIDPADETGQREARLDQANRSRTINPVAGFILPDFIDESIEFFDQDGTPLGEVLHDPVTGGVTWEGGVGREGPAATSPADGLPASARLCGRIAQGMIDADIAQRNDPETAEFESPLSAFLRAVDTTMWGVDSDLLASGAAIAGLVGRPVAVISTVLWLDIPTDLAMTDAYGESADEIRDHLLREAVFDAVKSRTFQVRLGEFAKGHDGLYGFFIGNNFERFHLIDKEVSSAARSGVRGAGYRSLLGTVGGSLGANLLPPPSPLDCPFITEGKPLDINAGQRVRLTLLMHPSARVHATTGLLPRKSLELLRDWVTPGIGRIAPSARIGPVLIDPDKVRLPKIAAFGADQSWTRRDSPITWRDDPILSATQAALLPDGSVTVEEGYIRIAPNGEADGGEDA